MLTMQPREVGEKYVSSACCHKGQKHVSYERSHIFSNILVSACRSINLFLIIHLGKIYESCSLFLCILFGIRTHFIIV